MSEVKWFNVEGWGVEGKGWHDTKHFFDRLPARAEGIVRGPVWQLSQHCAGMIVQFHTDADTIKVRWRLRFSEMSLAHMPSTGVSGVDLYCKDRVGKWRWLGLGFPGTTQDAEATVATGLEPLPREFMLYLPLYNGVERVEIGVNNEASFTPVAPRKDKPIVFYGTSITHGACASRPGMHHVGILGRRLNVPVINLGFSGQGQMEIEVASLLAELDPSIFVIDCLPNMSDQMVQERTEPLVKTIREEHPKTPIVLVEDRDYGNSYFFKAAQQGHLGRRVALRAAYNRLRDGGTDHLYYVTGAQLLGDDGEATVDSSHPTDLGFMRISDVLEPILRTLL
ncbi:MAG: SGNH/GDSL hydrolase family protein [Limnochordia bacterium]|jgi:hypothetical protein|nr:SGNH/GDSL hydrolase family protein [Limnochordia bacterium]MDD2629231.1 SGNH/GDSL hydrolase family protein [Limnochordia bacterium]MDD4517953.1 SGNH/GDSL hydrolase family protein [Limnochordia bacterium]